MGKEEEMGFGREGEERWERRTYDVRSWARRGNRKQGGGKVGEI